MLLFLIALALGAIAGLALGGRPGRLAELRLAHAWLVLAAAALQLLPYAVALGDALHSTALLASYVLVAVWLAANARGREPRVRTAFALLALGWALNFAAVAANDGMPVSRDALRAAGLPASEAYITEGSLYKHVPAGDGTRLRALGDVIPLTVPNARVISAGDVALLLGAGWLVAAALCAGGAPAQRRAWQAGAASMSIDGRREAG